MHEDSESIESLLLDLHLNRLDESRRLEVEQALAESSELTAQSRALRGTLALLDQYPAPEPPPDLAESILARVSDQTKVIPFPQPAPAAPAEVSAASPVLSLRELVAIAACITLFVGIFVPGYFKAQNIARRNLCRDNFRQIYAATDQYVHENNGYVMYAGFVPQGSWLPTTVPNVRRASNTVAFFKLLRGGYVRDGRVFVCPATPHSRPMVAENYREFHDFAEPANISYSFQFMNLPRGRRLEHMDVQMVLMADRNPLFDGRAIHQLSPYDDETNSISHEEGAGQNAVYVSGRGGWFTQPTIGVDSDNIYRAGKTVRYQGTEQPVSQTDTFLVN